MDRKPTISDLLALRDAEPGDAAHAARMSLLAAEVENDPASRAELERLERLRDELRALPPVTPPPAVWEAVRERTGQRGPRWLERFPLATAATVFLAAALTIVLWDPAGRSRYDGGPRAQDPVAELMLRSQRLESELSTPAGMPVFGERSSEQALLYGIADVDAQLSALYASDTPDAVARERLWRQRVMLLESLADVQRSQAVLRPAIY